MIKTVDEGRRNLPFLILSRRDTSIEVYLIWTLIRIP